MRRPRTILLPSVLLVSIIVAGMGPAEAAGPTRAKLRSPDGQRPFGTALYEEEGAERALEVAIARLPIRRVTLIVRAKGVTLGLARIRAGEGEFEVDNTTGDTVPRIRPDDRITLRRRSGTLVLSGTF